MNSLNNLIKALMLAMVILGPTMTAGLVEEYRIKECESEMTIQTSRYPKGLCIVSLKVNGRVVESRQVVLE